MPLPIPQDLWVKVIDYLETHQTGKVILHQHQGRVIKVTFEETYHTQDEERSRLSVSRRQLTRST